MARKSATAWFERFESWTETKVGRAADAVVSGLAPGNVSWLRCWTPGQAVDNGAFHSVYWFALPQGGWVSAAWLYTGPNALRTIDRCPR